MKRRVLALSMVTALSIMISGCGEESTNCRFEVQQNIDEGNFEAAVAALTGSCKESYSAVDRYFNLGVAKMGIAGFGISDSIQMLSDVSDTNDDAFVAFTRKVKENKKAVSLSVLKEAKQNLIRSIDPNATDTNSLPEACNNPDQSPRVANACLYLGYSDSLLSATTVTYLTKDIDTALESIQNESGQTPDDLKASVDALAWASTKALPNGSTITPKSVTIGDKAYKHLEVVLNGKTFYRLATKDAPKEGESTLVTDGYCNTQGAKEPCAGIEKEDGSIDTSKLNASGCYACPVDLQSDDVSVAQLLVDTINNSKETIVNISDDEDIRKSVNDFIEEITGDPNGKVTIDDVIEYLNK